MIRLKSESGPPGNQGVFLRGVADEMQTSDAAVAALCEDAAYVLYADTTTSHEGTDR